MRVAPLTGRPTFPPRRSLICLAILALAMVCPACSSGRKPVHPVRGRVLINGKPAAQAQVLFHPVPSSETEPRPTGQTDDQGYFTLTSYASNDGASEGEYAVTVTLFRVARSGKEELVPYNVLPPRYASQQTSRLHATVTSGSNDLTPFQLTAR